MSLIKAKIALVLVSTRQRDAFINYLLRVIVKVIPFVVNCYYRGDSYTNGFCFLNDELRGQSPDL
jgi:hypothetical protein